MSTKAKRHTHKYYKAREFNRPDAPYVWTCGQPDCTHHMPKHYEHTLKGKYSVCWRCNETLILDDRAWKMDKPLCEDCDPNTFDIEKTTDVLTELGLVNKVTGE